MNAVVSVGFVLALLGILPVPSEVPEDPPTVVLSLGYGLKAHPNHTCSIFYCSLTLKGGHGAEYQLQYYPGHFPQQPDILEIVLRLEGKELTFNFRGNDTIYSVNISSGDGKKTRLYNKHLKKGQEKSWQAIANRTLWLLNEHVRRLALQAKGPFRGPFSLQNSLHIQIDSRILRYIVALDPLPEYRNEENISALLCHFSCTPHFR